MRGRWLGAYAGLALAATLTACGDGKTPSAQAATQADGGGGGGIQLIRDDALGDKYGTPTGPRRCSTQKIRGDGPPSPEDIGKLVICESEGESSDSLYVLSNVRITDVGNPRGYNANEDINVGDIDVDKPIYAIRGSYERYQCAAIQEAGSYDWGPDYHRGTNCTFIGGPRAEGLCYVDTFDDWHCKMVDTVTDDRRRNVPAPTE